MPDYILKSTPIELFWAGWRTDTVSLQRAGWELAAHEDVRFRKMQIAIRHPEYELRGLSEFGTHEYFEILHSQYGMRRRPQARMNMTHLGHNIVIRTMYPGEIVFNPIDAEPRVMEERVESIDDLAHFAKIHKPKNEVYLKEASMAEILEMALQKQEPEQEKIRKRIMQEQQIKRCGQLHTALNII